MEGGQFFPLPFPTGPGFAWFLLALGGWLKTDRDKLGLLGSGSMDVDGKTISLCLHPCLASLLIVKTGKLSHTLQQS